MSERLAGAAKQFVGREHELRQLDAACAAAREGRGSVVVVSGEAGIGKTRFCEEVGDRAARAGLSVVSVRCWVDGGAPALWPWQPLLTELCGPDAADLLASDTGLPTVDASRFARFVAVTKSIGEACARNPACLIVDDVHAADAGTLLLTRFVARSLHRLPLLVVLSTRSGEPADDGTEARLLAEIESEAMPIVLRRFDLDETTTFLAAHDLQSVPAELSLTLFRVTGGHPLFLRRIAALGPSADATALPQGLQVAIDQAVTGLSPAALGLLRQAAVLGPSPSVSEAARVAGTDAVSLLAAVDEAVAAGLVVRDSPHQFAFSHQLVRDTFESRLDVTERLATHARAASIVAVDETAGPRRLARRAHHARVAAPRSTADARLAVVACRQAAREMVRSFDYEQADTLLSAAVALHEESGLGPPPGPLLLEWAQAALRCGHMTEARVRFGHAADPTQVQDDPVLLAEAALGLAGHWLNEQRGPVERARVLGLLRTANALLPADEVVLRCRLHARMAAEAVFDGGPLEAVYAALDATRRCGDQRALAEVLSLCHHALFNAEHTHNRLELADELIRVASEAGDGVLALMGLCWRTVDLLHLGDRRAPRALAELRERANALANQNILWVVGVIDAMLLIRQGRLDEAEAASARCRELGEAVGEVDALGYQVAQAIGIRWMQDRDGEILELAADVAESPKLLHQEFSLRASAAVILARNGQHKQARAALDRLAANGLANLPQSSTWLIGMVSIVEVAGWLGDAAVAREAYDVLIPFAGVPAIASLGVLCAGSTERSLGLAALIFEDVERAVAHLERAVAANHRLGNRPMLVVAQAELAAALQRRDHGEDHIRAADMLRQAVREAEACGMTSRADTWQSQLMGVVDRPADRAPAQVEPRVGVIYRDENRWVVGVDDRQVRVGDLVGMGYLATLLTQPGRPVSALTLAAQGAVPDDPAPQELLDDKARASYSARARELSVLLEEAEADNDIVRAERVRDELDALVEELEAATGLGDRRRRFADPAERARTSVRKAIKRAIDIVADADAALARLLRSTIDTGHVCSYQPDLSAPVTWSTRPLGRDVDVASALPAPPPAETMAPPQAV